MYAVKADSIAATLSILSSWLDHSNTRKMETRASPQSLSWLQKLIDMVLKHAKDLDTSETEMAECQRCGDTDASSWLLRSMGEVTEDTPVLRPGVPIARAFAGFGVIFGVPTAYHHSPLFPTKNAPQASKTIRSRETTNTIVRGPMRWNVGESSKGTAGSICLQVPGMPLNTRRSQRALHAF